MSAKPEEDNEPLNINLLEALEKLEPPQTGIVKSVELRGRIFTGGHARYHLTRDTSKRVRRALGKARVSQERITIVSGLVREFDKDDPIFLCCRLKSPSIRPLRGLLRANGLSPVW